MGEGVGGGRSLFVFDHTSSYQSEVKIIIRKQVAYFQM